MIQILLCLSLGFLFRLSIGLLCVQSMPGKSEIRTISCNGVCMRQVVLMETGGVNDIHSTRFIAIARDCSTSALTEEFFANCSDTNGNKIRRPEPRVITCFCSTDYCNF
ncbi:hypothetical protein RB195_013112 [Necator americanus]|uniref:ET module n=1 Tax=Necator americanus TaxID=51031 RepID=A0ABR1DU87_NECAM